MELNDPVTQISGIGIEVAKKFRVLGISTAEELIHHYPRRYDDYSQVETINKIRPGMVTIRAAIKQSSGRYASRGLHITEAVASDDTSSVRLIWFNQPYRAASLNSDKEYYISGDFGLRRQRLSIQNPSIEFASSFPVNTARIVPIYRETKGLKSTQFRRALKEALPLIKSLSETLPDWLVQGSSLDSRAEAVEQIHFPSSPESLAQAKKRLGFEEVFELTLAALLNKQDISSEAASSIKFDEKLAKKFVEHLPFKLTDDQRRATWQILKDMQNESPMNRLLEGDVGSGKTVVATMAALMAIHKGFQVAFMSPTELLARQHADTVFKLLQPLGMSELVGLLIGGLKPPQKAKAQAMIKKGHMKLIIGTHALISDKVDFHNLGLIIIDEQHRFGVDQRKAMEAKVGHVSHVLSMTATPIPRSLALTLYGELDISLITTKPADRKPTVTEIVLLSSREQMYEEIDKQIELGRQIFVVCPLITQSNMISSKSAEQVFKELSVGKFKHRRVGLLHGKMKSADKDQTMQKFVSHKLDMIVSTTVIEVGVDVPNATVMVLENAERFGLAQIHQLRGRVGRSNHQGYCYLVMGDSQSPSARIRAVKSSSDGFKLAEYDLELRGPGAIYGTMQHGQLDLRIAKLTDVRLIAQARASAQEFIDKGENLLNYKQLHARVNKVRAITNLN